VARPPDRATPWTEGLHQAVRKEVSVLFSGKPDGPKMDILIYLPANRKRSFPRSLD